MAHVGSSLVQVLTTITYNIHVRIYVYLALAYSSLFCNELNKNAGNNMLLLSYFF